MVVSIRSRSSSVRTRACTLGPERWKNRQVAGHYASRGNQRGNHVKRFFSSFDTDTKKWVLRATLRGCSIRDGFSPFSGTPVQFSLRGIQKGERP
jgi:hypothetical protein